MRRVYLGLAACLALAGASTAFAKSPGSGISGRVLEGPSCPVERVPPAPGCAPRALAATLRISRSGSETAVRTVHSGRDGRFRVSLAPGAYTVRGLPQSRSGLPRPPEPHRVQVRAGHFTAITITYDTGIR